MKGGRGNSEVLGPKAGSIGKKKAASLPLEIELKAEQDAIRIKLDGDEALVRSGEFSKWFRPEFFRGHLRQGPGPVPFLPGRIESVALVSYADSDRSLGAGLPDQFTRRPGREKWPTESVGYHTMGMPEDTNALNEGHLDEKAFLEKLP